MWWQGRETGLTQEQTSGQLERAWERKASVALTEFVLSEKLPKLLWQKVKTGGKDTSPARTLYSAGEVACKSCSNWGILLSNLSGSVGLLLRAGKVMLALKTLCLPWWALLPKGEGHFHTPDTASSGCHSWGAGGRGWLPWDAVNAIYCWQAKKQFKKESDCGLKHLISTTLVDKPCKTLLVSRRVKK